MTSVQIMRIGQNAKRPNGQIRGAARRRSASTVAMVLLAATFIAAGCAGKRDRDALTPPVELVAPYSTAYGDVLWAVAPLRNESGTSLANPLAVSDKVVAAASQVRGVQCRPLNSTLEAMRALEMDALRSPSDVHRLAEAMGVDGVIVGSITAFDPYEPVLGLSLALYARPGHLDRRGTAELDTRRLVMQPTDYDPFGRGHHGDRPASVVSEHLDGKNHGVQAQVKRYGAGRSDPGSALRWRRYLASMDLYTEFAAWQTVGRLVDHEWIRLARGEGRASAR